MTVRIVVADRSAARFYDADRIGGPLRLFDDLQRGSVPRHATGSEHEGVHHETQVFASRIAEILWAAHGLRQFDRLVLMAEPAFLGVLRTELPKSLSAITVATIGKDFMHEKPARLEKVVRKALSSAVPA